MSPRRLLPAALALAAVTAAAPRAVAQSAPAATAPVAEARTLFEQGLRLVAAERWGEALEFFQRSRAIVERPSTVFNVGSVLVRLGRMSEAIATLEQFLRVSDAQANAAERAEAQRLLADARSARTRLTLTLSVPDAELSLDGVVVPGDGASRTIDVDPGAHRVRATAAGHDDASASVSVLPGTPQTLALALRPRPSQLVLAVTPAQAAVTLDGVSRGAARRFEVTPGSHALRLDAAGFVTLEREARVAVGQTLSLDLALARRPPSRITASPWFWTAVGVVVVGSTAAILAATLTETLAPYGGSTDTVLSAVRSEP